MMKYFLMVLTAFMSATTFAKGLPEQVVVTDFMKVEAVDVITFLEKEKALKKIHQQRIDQGIITGWYLYKVRFAGDEYNYVTITTHADFDSIEHLYDKNIIDEPSKTVKSEMSKLMAFTGKNKPSQYMLMAFIIVDEKNKDTYIKGEKTIWKPAHQELIKTSS
ncbi:hypothetical protein [Flagellimonas sp. CMM7]|uniref:hypothetical protein n=1 Tax=Flagellimonas sp. CMM7 TaxID=2654676 RepID=UPI0013D0F357|nr:hypothetical protein [Flagellimonas sp. CMM7]UII80335.1 hypothetical protein LV704_02200 [Flagellimonas sp. CMM7]